MKGFFTERNIVILLFATVLVTFSLAHEDSKQIEKFYTGSTSTTVSQMLAENKLPVQSPQHP